MTENEEEGFSSLYIHLYFDEDVSAGIVENLRTRGFDVLSVRDAGALGKSDDEQMLYAVSLRRAVVTHNRVDFEKQHRKFLEIGMKHYGVIISKRRKDAEVVTKLLAGCRDCRRNAKSTAVYLVPACCNLKLWGLSSLHQL